MNNKTFLSCGIFLVMLLFCQSMALGAKIDNYRAIMKQNAFTIKYKVESATEISDNSEIYIQDGKTYTIEKQFDPEHKKTLQDWYNNEYKDVPIGGIIVVNGKNRYTEVLYKDRNMAIANKNDDNKTYDLMELTNLGNYFLQKDGEKFYYVSGSRKGHDKAFYGTLKRPDSIKPNESFLNQFFTDDIEPILEANYGNSVIGHILAAIYTDKTNSYVPRNYKLSTKGNADSGETYEEYFSNQEDNSYLVKFFFNGDRLVRATSVFNQKNDGNLKNKIQFKNIVYFMEFSPTPDEKYFNLPIEVEVVRD